MSTPVRWRDGGHRPSLVHLARKPFVTLCGNPIPAQAECLPESTPSDCPACIRREYGRNAATKEK